MLIFLVILIAICFLLLSSLGPAYVLFTASSPARQLPSRTRNKILAAYTAFLALFTTGIVWTLHALTADSFSLDYGFVHLSIIFASIALSCRVLHLSLASLPSANPATHRLATTGNLMFWFNLVLSLVLLGIYLLQLVQG